MSKNTEDKTTKEILIMFGILLTLILFTYYGMYRLVMDIRYPSPCMSLNENTSQSYQHIE